MTKSSVPSRSPSGGERLRAAAPLGTLLSALGVAASVRPLWDLFEGTSWLPPLTAVIVVVALSGMAGRAASAPRPLVPLCSTVLLVGVLTAVFAPDTAMLGLVPTPDTLSHVTALLLDARESIASSAPPAPSTTGVVFVVAAAAGVIAVLTDTIANTYRSPAAAGLPMVVPFLIAVANSATGLPPEQFLAPMACWLGMMALSEPRSGHAGRTARHRDGALLGARLGFAALISVATLVLGTGLAAVFPVAPSSVISDRLGLAGGSGRVGFTASPDMLTDLADPNPTSVLDYTTDDPSTPPLRVSVSSVYRDGQWQSSPVREPVSSTPLLPQPPGLTEDVAQTRRSIDAGTNRLAAPNLAAPGLVTDGVVTGAEWSMDPDTGIIAVGTMPTRYRLSYLSLAPTPEQLRVGATSTFDSGSPLLDSSALSASAARTAQEITAGASTPYEQAVALQNWFRDEGNFTYSLQLEPPPEGMSDREAARTSVDRFLESRRGYCVQFSTAMTLMARHHGIPARLASGFLPGRQIPGGSREVRSSDAHAWPELYFEGIGWLRFEPTPGVQSGPPPDYAPEEESPATTPTATPSADAAPTPTPTPTPQQPEPPAPEDSVPAPATSGAWDTVVRMLPWVVIIAAVAVALAAPYLAGKRRRRARFQAATGPEARVDAVWIGLREQLADLGYRASPALVLPDAARELARGIDLDEPTAARLEALALAVQHARYAPPRPAEERGDVATSADDASSSAPHGSTAPAGSAGVVVLEAAPETERLTDDAAAVLAAARERTPWIQRVVGTAWPASGREALSESLTRRYDGVTDRVRSRLRKSKRNGSR